ncbi:MAG: tRNA (guanosine(46)-N7)-methyltransferase TrmB [Chlamydiales bacterium]|nr:tRNA (guanosine(46)-N7)-methyltransferase TrmB [Chlamydiales bacterium]NCF70072.1 tRNA (guanosine(46)-N7)-methyltransferase TrmB [Chlamydiales bacterium]
MKPSDLKPFFTFDERNVVLKDKIWCVPTYFDDYESFKFSGFNSPEFFGNDRPVLVEFCSGNGDWILEKAKSCPEVNFVAVEIQFKRVKKIWSKMNNDKVDNLMIICGDGRLVAQKYFKESSIDGVYINFPDPWPKKRHIKHRIIQESFVKDMARFLKKDGSCVFVTDSEPYLEETIEYFSKVEAFSHALPLPFYLKDPKEYGYSYFKNLWTSLGRDIYLYEARVAV